MSLKALWLYLANDVPSAVTTSASGVQALNSDIWKSAAQVPSYAYQSLGEILIGSSCSSSELGLHIVYQLGEALEESTSEISLLGSFYESTELARKGLNSNEIGAETLKLDIAFRLPEESQDWDRLINAELRVRYLLDHTWRQRRKGVSPYVPNLGDFTLNGQIVCFFEDYPVPPNAKEIFARYTLAYTRAVPR